jgi:hypothetical protein
MEVSGQLHAPSALHPVDIQWHKIYTKIPNSHDTGLLSFKK